MTNTFKPQFPMLRVAIAVVAVTLLVGISSGQAHAQGAVAQSPTAGQSVGTSRGSAFITGHLGSLETTTLPGSGGQGFLMNNGNGTSTLMIPGGIPQTVATPK
jgi:hypothetical protein